MVRGLCALAMLAALTGCTTWRESPLTSSRPAPLALEVGDATKTIDLSYRFSGDDQRWQEDAYRRLIVGVYERCGYLVHEVPWSSQPGQAARIRVGVVNMSNRAWLTPSWVTLGALPGYGKFSADITIDARANGFEARQVGSATAKSFVWLPVFWLFFTSRSIIQLQDEGVEEVILKSVVDLRRLKILLSP